MKHPLEIHETSPKINRAKATPMPPPPVPPRPPRPQKLQALGRDRREQQKALQPLRQRRRRGQEILLGYQWIYGDEWRFKQEKWGYHKIYIYILIGNTRHGKHTKNGWENHHVWGNQRTIAGNFQ